VEAGNTDWRAVERRMVVARGWGQGEKRRIGKVDQWVLSDSGKKSGVVLHTRVSVDKDNILCTFKKLK
jgi:hypothetical protein